MACWNWVSITNSRHVHPHPFSLQTELEAACQCLSDVLTTFVDLEQQTSQVTAWVSTSVGALQHLCTHLHNNTVRAQLEGHLASLHKTKTAESAVPGSAEKAYQDTSKLCQKNSVKKLAEKLVMSAVEKALKDSRVNKNCHQSGQCFRRKFCPSTQIKWDGLFLWYRKCASRGYSGGHCVWRLEYCSERRTWCQHSLQHNLWYKEPWIIYK